MTRHQAGALWLVLLTACASTTRVVPQGSPPEPFPDVRLYEVDDIEPGTVSTRPVHMDKGEFQRALARMTDARWRWRWHWARCWRRRARHWGGR